MQTHFNCTRKFSMWWRTRPAFSMEMLINIKKNATASRGGSFSCELSSYLGELFMSSYVWMELTIFVESIWGQSRIGGVLRSSWGVHAAVLMRFLPNTFIQFYSFFAIRHIECQTFLCPLLTINQWKTDSDHIGITFTAYIRHFNAISNNLH